MVCGCGKNGHAALNTNRDEWMASHQRALVAYSDSFSGNYIIQTPQGFAVVENQGSLRVREHNLLYAQFQLSGMQTTDSSTQDYFFTGG